MNISEANAVNTVLYWALRIPRPSTGVVPADHDAKEAADLLALRAFKTLSAGLRPGELDKHWPYDTDGEPTA